MNRDERRARGHADLFEHARCTDAIAVGEIESRGFRFGRIETQMLEQLKILHHVMQSLHRGHALAEKAHRGSFPTGYPCNTFRLAPLTSASIEYCQRFDGNGTR